MIKYLTPEVADTKADGDAYRQLWLKKCARIYDTPSTTCGQMRGIQQRVQSLKGTCNIFSQPGEGTSIAIDIPVKA